MEKKVLTYEELDLYTTIYDGANCRVCRHDNTAMKLYKPVRVSHLEAYNVSEMIEKAHPIDNVPEIVIPTSIKLHEEDNSFWGFTYPYVPGVVLREYLKDHEQEDLSFYTDLFVRIRDIVKRGEKSKSKVIFPDIASCLNIIVTPDNRLRIIDYDGLQINGIGTLEFSEAIYHRRLRNWKYQFNSQFTKDLDRLSLIYLYFKLVFNINIVQKLNLGNFDMERMQLNDIFKKFNIPDNDLKDKVSKILSNCSKNEDILENVLALEKDYELSYTKQNDVLERKLIRK